MPRKSLGPLGPDVDATVTAQKVDATVKDIARDHAPFFVFENSRNFQRAVFIF